MSNHVENGAHGEWVDTVLNFLDDEGAAAKLVSPSVAAFDDANSGSNAAMPPQTCCWGAQLKALHGVNQPPCDASFAPGKSHLKNKFCQACRNGIVVPASHVRALTPALEQTFANYRSGGLWSRSVIGGSEVEFRVLNHTKACHGGTLALFVSAPPPSLDWATMPTEWLSSSQDTLELAVANGTLVPVRSIRQRYYGTHLHDKRMQLEQPPPPPPPQQQAMALDVASGSTGLLSMATVSTESVASGGGDLNSLPNLLPLQSHFGPPATILTFQGKRPMSSTSTSSDGSTSGIGSGAKQARAEPHPPAVFAGQVSEMPSSSMLDHGQTRVSISQLPSVSSRGLVSRGSMLSSFLPSAFGLRSTLPSASEQPRPSQPGSEAEELLPPSPPMSPPDPHPLAGSSAAQQRVGSLAVRIHPLTLRFSSEALENTWRHAHAKSILPVAMFVVPIQPAAAVALALAEPNEGARTFLLAWGIGWLPASIALLWIRGSQDGAKELREGVHRILDWAACSLCILPQILLTAMTWRGVKQPLDPLDPATAETFGKLLGNWLFAQMYLRANATHHVLNVLTVVASAALMCFQSPVSTAPHLEFITCRKGIIAGQLGGYILEYSMRSEFLQRQDELSRGRAPRDTATTTTTADSSVPAADSSGGSKEGATSTALRRTASAWLSRQSLTLRFSSAEKEAQYRQLIFMRSYTYLSYISGATTAMYLHNYAEGQSESAAACLSVVFLQALPRMGRTRVHQRGNQAGDVRAFRRLFWLFNVCVLVAKMLLPSYAGNIDAKGHVDVEVWLVIQPLLLRLQGPDVRFSWLSSVLAVGLSHVAPAWTWRGNREADAAGVQSAVITGEVLAHFFDWALRVQFHGGLENGPALPAAAAAA